MDGRLLRARLQRARQDRERHRSRRNTCGYFLDGEPSPGIAYEYELVRQLLPTITTQRRVGAGASRCSDDDSRVILAVSPQKPGIRIPTEADLQAALTSGARRACRRRGPTTARRATLMDKVPDAGHGDARADARRARRHRRPLRERRRGVAEADRFQERPGAVHAERAWRRVAGAAGRLSRSRRWRRLRRAVGRRRAQGARPAEGADRQARVGATVSSSLSTPRHLRERRAGAARDGAAAAPPGVHRARRRSGGVRAAEAAARSGGRQSRTRRRRRCSARRCRRSTPRTTTPRSR